jgi:glycosyltransferase involved in cell wall biosynthesis
VLCGEGPERKNIESFCKAEGLEGRILLMGYVPKVETFLLKSKIFVLTSKAEGLPMCLLEARSCGVPCVSFDVPTGPADLIDDGVNGYLIEPFDVKAMAKKLESLMKDEELLSNMAKKAPKGMEEFQLSGIVLQWKNLIDQLLE